MRLVRFRKFPSFTVVLYITATFHLYDKTQIDVVVLKIQRLSFMYSVIITVQMISENKVANTKITKKLFNI